MEALRDWLKQKKTIVVMLMGIVASWLAFGDGQLSFWQAVLSSFAQLGVIFYKSGVNRQENALNKLLDGLKDASLVLALCILPFVAIGCCSADIHDEVTALRREWGVYNEFTEPRADLSEENKARVRELEDRLDDSFAKLEELTR